MRAHDDLEGLLPLPPATFHILVALSDADRHGYGIMQEVAQRTGGRTKLNPGTLYTTIQRLLEKGLIVELNERRDPDEDDERRRYYRLTPSGRRESTTVRASYVSSATYRLPAALVRWDPTSARPARQCIARGSPTPGRGRGRARPPRHRGPRQWARIGDREVRKRRAGLHHGMAVPGGTVTAGGTRRARLAGPVARRWRPRSSGSAIQGTEPPSRTA